jgi:hypothetical protein
VLEKPAGWTVETLTASNGVATAGIWRARRDAGISLIVKVVARQDFPESDRPDHFGYWRREALAYTSGLLPSGPHLVAPRCYRVVEAPDRITLYLEDVAGPAADLDAAAYALAAWKGSASTPAERWLSGHQVAQRIARTDANGGLDWSEVPVDTDLRRRLSDAWAQRHRLLDALDRIPAVLSHGDFHRWNLFAGPTGAVVAIDWGGLGLAPIGSDLAYLVLSDPSATTDRLREPYLRGLADAGWSGDPRHTLLGYCATAGLVGVSRTHWTMTRPGADTITAYAEWSVSKVDEALSHLDA